MSVHRPVNRCTSIIMIIATIFMFVCVQCSAKATKCVCAK